MEKQKDTKAIDDLITQYLSEGLNEDEFREMKSRIDASEVHKKDFLRRREIWFSTVSANEARIYDIEKGYKKFLTRTSTKKKSSRVVYMRIARYAALVLLVISVAIGSYRIGSQQVKEQFGDISIEAPLGSKTKTYLPDGTLVWLNAGSKIRYSQGFGVENRKIFLSGEGYFDVIKNEKLSFDVITDEIQVNVLGTKFNFRNYSDDLEACISLLEGKVGLKSKFLTETKDQFLFPDQKIILNKKDGSFNISSVKASNTVEWTNGYLYFDEELLSDIVRELERSYFVKIDMSDEKLKDFRFYGIFKRSDLTIEEVMELLHSTGKLDYSITGKKIVLRAK